MSFSDAEAGHALLKECLNAAVVLHHSVLLPLVVLLAAASIRSAFASGIRAVLHWCAKQFSLEQYSRPVERPGAQEQPSETAVVNLLPGSGAVQRSSVARPIEVRGHVNRPSHDDDYRSGVTSTDHLMTTPRGHVNRPLVSRPVTSPEGQVGKTAHPLQPSKPKNPQNIVLDFSNFLGRPGGNRTPESEYDNIN